MNPNFLDFEQPIAELEAKIEELRLVGSGSKVNISDEIAKLQEKNLRYVQRRRSFLSIIAACIYICWQCGSLQKISFFKRPDAGLVDSLTISHWVCRWNR